MSRYKPYPAYKDSGVEWIGQVPEHWENLRIKRSARLRNERRNDSPAGLPYVGLEDIEPESGRYVPTTGTSRQSDDSMVGVFRADDVLYGKLRPYLRKAIVAEQDGVCSTEFLVLSAERASAPWLHRWLLTSEVTQQIEAGCEGAKMPRTDWEHVGSIPMPLPSLVEQTAIAAAIDRENSRIDALIAKKTRFIELLKEKRQALITQAVTKGLDPTVPMKDSGVEWIGEVPAHWKMLKVGRVTKRVKTGGTPSGAGQEMFSEQGENWFSPADFRSNLYLTESTRRLSEQGSALVRKFPAETVLLVGIGATIGKVGIAERECSCNQQINAIVCADDVAPEFLAHRLGAARDFIIKCGKYTTLPIINQEDTRALPVPLPSIEEQREIVSMINEQTQRLDRVVEKTLTSIDLLKERRSALITAAVTGQIDLRENAA